jgi:transcriptional regulator with XRE-family HTH domain
MKKAVPPKDLERLRTHIAKRTRELRTARKLTQGDLAARIGLSQSRLSEIEHGKGSFTAEQFVLLQRLFNVTSHDLAGVSQDARSELQNALARLGALHLQESDVLPSERLERAHDAIREAIIDGTPRLLTSIAPVLVRHGSELNLFRLDGELEKVGLDRRFGWVVENTYEAVRKLRERRPRIDPLLRQAEANLHIYMLFRDTDTQRARRSSAPLDVLDRSIRTSQTIDEVQKQSSDISRRWRIVTAIRPDDFVQALEAADASY